MVGPAQHCPVCDKLLGPAGEDWLQRCSGCGFLCSTLRPEIETTHDASAIDEGERAVALKTLRQGNFVRILDLLGDVMPLSGKRLLDVGCGHGWFLQSAKDRGFEPQGLEPDAAISRTAARTGLPVRHGYFPHDLPAGASFDVITFNDVFEHLPDIGQAMQAARDLLAPGGILVINLPVRTGIFYRMASWLKAVGFRKPFERLWQKGFPSPHLSYFRADHLRRLAERHGLRCELERPLQAIQGEGLWQRLRYDRKGSRLLAGVVYTCVMLSLPILRLLPSDIRVFFFRKPASRALAA